MRPIAHLVEILTREPQFRAFPQLRAFDPDPRSSRRWPSAATGCRWIRSSAEAEMAREDAETRGVEMLASCSSWGAERRGLGQLTEGIDCWANGRWNDHWTAPGASPGPGPPARPPGLPFSPRRGVGYRKKTPKFFGHFFPPRYGQSAVRWQSGVAIRWHARRACGIGMPRGNNPHINVLMGLAALALPTDGIQSACVLRAT